MIIDDPRGWLRDFSLDTLRCAVVDTGFASVRQALHQPCMVQLSQEAAFQRDAAVVAEGNSEISYRARIGSLGGLAKSFLCHKETQDLLTSVFTKKFVLSEDASCFTFYGPGDHLAAHRDQADSCAATLILYLDARSPYPSNSDTGLKLKIYGANLPEHIKAVKEIPTQVGTLVLGRGSEIWHERPPLLAGEFVSALTACFSVKV